MKKLFLILAVLVSSFANSQITKDDLEIQKVVYTLDNDGKFKQKTKKK